jgi:acyl-CoA reductase-like NAD-dependent aldehyde dehydrogenase
MGTGGMATKLQAADLARRSGTMVVIADGGEPEVLTRIAAGENLGTRFYPVATAVESRKRYILAGGRAPGRVRIDAGAAQALQQEGSLLPVGVTVVEETFERGDTIQVLNAIAADLRHVAALADPVGEIFEASTLPNGLAIRKRRVPLGVRGVIYEARPNVTVDTAGLALKTGNAVILRGDSETLNSNRALVAVIQQALIHADFPPDAVQFIDDTDRARVTELLALDEYVDTIIPRGGASLHRYCRQYSRIPVITGGIGICHLFVDDSDDPA